jgi:pyruvate/2-oxoglutarate dehydrogenase complex dihydrolipoamide dehydrogenase (E3) component
VIRPATATDPGAVHVEPDDVHNRALVANVHPPGWRNPTPASRYNLVVIGAGTAGLVSAVGAASLGGKVALVERHLLGGDCLNYGCVPSKTLIRAARAVADARAAGAFGIEGPAHPAVDFSAVMDRVRRVRAELSPTDSAARLRSLGVDVFLGDARFKSARAVAVDGALLRFSKAVLATGARAAHLPIPGLAETGYLTNETVFSLTELPRRLAVIGAGPLGCELAQAFARLGSLVTLLEAMPRILPREDDDAAARVEAALVRDGVKIVVGCKTTGVFCRETVSRTAEAKTISVEKDGVRHDVVVDEILVGVGRAPNVEGLDLEAAGIAYDAHGVHVDARLRTTNRRVFAAGDICSHYQFTHMADALARIAIQNALFLGRRRTSALTIPWCTYTDPEIAHVGMYEKDAAARGIAVKTFVQELEGVDRARIDGETDGFVKVHVRAGSDEILGATIVARHAGESISELTLAIVGRLGLKTIEETIHPYPTQAEAIRKVADAYSRSRLTPRVKGVLAKWLALSS